MINGNETWKHIEALKQQTKRFFTNASLIPQDVDALCKNEGTQVYFKDGFLTLLHKENGFNRLYLYADQVERLREVTDYIITVSPLTVYERVSLQQNADLDATVLASCGWSHHNELLYWTCQGFDDIYECTDVDCSVETAVETDVHSLICMLYTVFDTKVSHLPDKNDVLRRICLGEVTVIRKENAIAAFAIIEKINRNTQYVYQILTTPEWRCHGFAEVLLKHSMASSPNTLFGLWVEKNNKLAKRLYTKLGFQTTTRVLNIWILKEDCYNENN